MSHFYCYAECRYAERHYAECRYAECHYAECRDAILAFLTSEIFPNKPSHSLPKKLLKGFSKILLKNEIFFNKK